MQVVRAHLVLEKGPQDHLAAGPHEDDHTGFLRLLYAARAVLSHFSDEETEHLCTLSTAPQLLGDQTRLDPRPTKAFSVFLQPPGYVLVFLGPSKPAHPCSLDRHLDPERLSTLPEVTQLVTQGEGTQRQAGPSPTPMLFLPFYTSFLSSLTWLVIMRHLPL